MSEEEKQAIKELTEIRELVEEDLKFEKYEATAILDQTDLKALVTVLDLVKKQQKEIFELNKEMTDFNDQWLHKDKLRELFEKVEISNYDSCVEFILAINHLLKWKE